MLLKVKCIWLCWLEYLLTLVAKRYYYEIVSMVSDYMEKYHCSITVAAKALSLCQEDRQACAHILILQSGTLDDAVETYLQQQFEQDISPRPSVNTP